MTENLDNYKLLEPVRAVRDFIGDLSTWYLRRSRERIKNGDKDAKLTLYFVLKTLAKLMAPFAPFAAEDIWLKLRNEKGSASMDGALHDSAESSVHLAEWPAFAKATAGEAEIIKNMQITRDICTAGNAERQKLNIPVRQALNKIFLKVSVDKEYQEIIKDELNVKNVVIKNIIVESNPEYSIVEFDAEITPALKAEGKYREFMRELQDRRKKLGLNPGDKMSMSITDVYKKYKIQPNLQRHMLFVAAVATMICDNFNEPLPKEDIVTACLLHDMGNIVKYELGYFPEFLEPQGLEYWQGVQSEFIEKYNQDEHEVTYLIVKELGLSDRIVELASGNGFQLLCKCRDAEDTAMKFMHYCDNRVGPYGIISYDERMEEAGKRYKNRADNKIKEEERQKLVGCGKDIEKQIFAKCKIKPEDINDETVAPIIAELRNFVIR